SGCAWMSRRNAVHAARRAAMSSMMFKRVPFRDRSASNGMIAAELSTPGGSAGRPRETSAGSEAQRPCDRDEHDRGVILVGEEMERDVLGSDPAAQIRR